MSLTISALNNNSSITANFNLATQSQTKNSTNLSAYSVEISAEGLAASKSASTTVANSSETQESSDKPK